MLKFGLNTFSLLAVAFFIAICCNDAYSYRHPYCELPVDPGMCAARFPRYFFNTATEQCEPFNYGGCQGNKNRFETKLHCLAVCLTKPMKKEKGIKLRREHHKKNKEK